ncbi:hypothetical protein BGZ63DRAFT_497158 [Mariannaea sp. PMI_226]|nr:hypothetical protein BGZ63DRAFT_497158 [Mariannaea sp. PMI_226]
MGSNVDRRIALDKVAHFLGTASIDFKNLSLNSSKLNRGNIQRIKALMQDGLACLPEKSNHQISAIIDKGHLEGALLAAQLSPEALLKHTSEYAELEFPDGYQLQCLQGHHRVLAASELEKVKKKRWVVKLFSSEIADETRRDLQDERSNEKDIEDGEFYYNIRLFEGHFHSGRKKDLRNARKWWALLAATKAARTGNARCGDESESYRSSKCDRLRQLFGNAVFTAAFDSFQHLPALYSGLRLSVVNKMLSMSCMDELLAMLNDTKRFWYYVFEDNEEAMEMLDVHSLSILDCSAPGANETERRELGALSANRQMLGYFNDAYRERVWLRICDATRHRMVPTLWGFFSNLNQLRPVVACLTQLVNVRNHSLRFSLSSDFSNSGGTHCLVQVSPHVCKSVPVQNVDCFEIAYRQLWLYAWREYQWLQPKLKRKLAGTESRPANAVILWGLARLAHKLGFRNLQIDGFLQKNPYRCMAVRHLQDVRIPGSGKSDAYEKCVDKIASSYASAWEQKSDQGSELSDGEDEIEDNLDMKAEIWSGKAFPALSGSKSTPTRCGLPRTEDHLRDRSLTFIQHMERPAANKDRGLSSFFTLQSLYSQVFSNRQIHIDLDSLLANAPHNLDQYLYDTSHLVEAETPVPTAENSMSESNYVEMAGVSESIRKLESQYEWEQRRLLEIREQIKTEEGRLQQVQSENEQLHGLIGNQQIEIENLNSQSKALREKVAQYINEANKKREIPAGKHESTQTDVPFNTKEAVLGIQGRGRENVESWDLIQALQTAINENHYYKFIGILYLGLYAREFVANATEETFKELAKLLKLNGYYILNGKDKVLNPEIAYEILKKDDKRLCSVKLQRQGKRKLVVREEDVAKLTRQKTEQPGPE